MGGLFTGQAFAGFGPSRFDPFGDARTICVRASRPSGLRAHVRLQCPRGPGVYGMLNENSELIYVGKAKNLRARLLTYFRPNSRDAKAGRILEQARAILWEPQPSEFAALLRELELIRRWRPRWNVQGQPARFRRSYLCIGRRPAPYAYTATKPPTTAIACYGPVPGGRRAREAVRRINDWFALRDCPQSQEMVFAEQGELFPIVRAAGCLRFEIGTCLGPCTGRCTRTAYRDRVQGAQKFLMGADNAPLQKLERDMNDASAVMEFERAARLRDTLGLFRWVREQLDYLNQARREHSFIYPVTGQGGRGVWYVIHDGRVRAVLPAPRNETESKAALRAATEVYQQKGVPGGALLPEEVDGVLLVAAWFRKHGEERARTFGTQ